MKAAILHKNGNPTTSEVLSVEENVDKPVLEKGEILVQVKAASINPIDWKLCQGDFPGKKSGLVGFDVAGIVQEIAPETDTTLKVGDQVYADAAATQGSFAEYCKVQAVALAKKPSNCSFQEAAALPLVGLTALQALQTGNFEKDKTVCILGGSGGVGSLAIQMAKAMGAAHVYATGSSTAMIKDLGADTVINYKEQNVVEELKGKELDLIFDTIGGLEGWQAAQAGLKPNGTFVTIVGDGGSLPSTLASMVWRKLKTVVGSPAYELILTNTKAPQVTTDMKTLTEMVESGKVKPVLDSRKFELTTDSVHEMIAASMSHRAKGKLVLNVS